MFDPCYLIILLVVIRNKDNVVIFNLVKLDIIAISLMTVTMVTLIMALSLFVSTLAGVKILIYSTGQKTPCLCGCACVCVSVCLCKWTHIIFNWVCFHGYYTSVHININVHNVLQVFPSSVLYYPLWWPTPMKQPLAIYPLCDSVWWCVVACTGYHKIPSDGSFVDQIIVCHSATRS